MIYDDTAYIQKYGATVRAAVWHAGKQHYYTEKAAKTAPISLAPLTDGIQVRSVKDAIHELFMACAAYYLERSSRGVGIPRDVSNQLLVMSRALRGQADRIGILNDAMTFFLRTVASVESQDIRDAIKAGQLTLKALQDSYAEMPVVSAQSTNPQNWML